MATTESTSYADEECDRKQMRRIPQYEAVIKETQWPIIYRSEYNIVFCGIEKFHPFDSEKWCHIAEFLKGAGMIRDDTIIEPMEVSDEELLVVHSKRYLSNLKLANIVEGVNEWNMSIVGIMEMPPLALLPNFIVQRKVLRPFRFQTSGSIMAGRLAIERGWAINIGGGFHHCSRDAGGGFCAYADITLLIKFVLENMEGISKVMVIDLDAQQGNGHERDFMGDKQVYILDIYNRDIYPQDGFAKRAISRKVEIYSFTENDTYLKLVRIHVTEALAEFTPDLVVYNAGTNVLAGDPMGKLLITAQGVIERDQIVFQKCRTQDIPICMLTSGGYLREAAKVVSESILNLKRLNLISCDAAENAPLTENDVPSLSRSHSDGGLFARFKRSYLTRSAVSTHNISDLESPLDSCSASSMLSFVTGDEQFASENNNF